MAKIALLCIDKHVHQQCISSEAVDELDELGDVARRRGNDFGSCAVILRQCVLELRLLKQKKFQLARGPDALF